MVPRSQPTRSLQATLLLAVAWLSFALSAVQIGEASSEADNVVRRAAVAAVPMVRTAASAEETSSGRGPRGAGHSPSMAASIEADVLVADVAGRVRLAPAAIVVPADPRLAPYDATAPPAPISIV
jgi:hypothetical protein